MEIFVGSLPLSMTAEQVEALFSAYGKVLSVRITKNPETEESKGFGFVTMAIDSEGRCAIRRLNKRVIEGKFLNVQKAKIFSPQRKPLRTYVSREWREKAEFKE